MSFAPRPDKLRAYFSHFGPIDACTIMRDGTGRSRGFAFLTFVEGRSVERVLSQLHTLDGKPVRSPSSRGGWGAAVFARPGAQERESEREGRRSSLTLDVPVCNQPMTPFPVYGVDRTCARARSSALSICSDRSQACNPARRASAVVKDLCRRPPPFDLNRRPPSLLHPVWPRPRRPGHARPRERPEQRLWLRDVQGGGRLRALSGPGHARD